MYYVDVWSGLSETIESGGFHLFCTYVRTPYIPVYRFYAARTNHRFYNFQNETHSYTASEAEKANVLATLRWKYRYDGPAYNVSATPVAGATAVWRFYNRKVGTHFYTASVAERDYVASALCGTWTFEGPGYYLAP